MPYSKYRLVKHFAKPEPGEFVTIGFLYELLGKPPYLPKKARPQKSYAPQEKSEKHIGIGAALDRVRNQLRRYAIISKEPIIEGGLQTQRKPISSEERKILDKMKQIEEL
jgi:hypothetical protein